MRDADHESGFRRPEIPSVQGLGVIIEKKDFIGFEGLAAAPDRQHAALGIAEQRMGDNNAVD